MFASQISIQHLHVKRRTNKLEKNLEIEGIGWNHFDMDHDCETMKDSNLKWHCLIFNWDDLNHPYGVLKRWCDLHVPPPISIHGSHMVVDNKKRLA